MSQEENNKKKFKQKITDKYRLVVQNESTYEERFSFRLNLLNIFVLGTLFSIFLIVATTFFIAYTPLKEYIPGYSSSKLKKQASELVYKVDSLQNIIEVNNLYMEDVKKVLTGKIEAPTFDKDSVLEVIRLEQDSIDFSPSDADLALREEVELNDRYSLFQQAKRDLDIVFFSPATGQVTEKYDINDKHFAVDVALTKDDPIKAMADGTVIFASWTPDTGYVIIIKHAKGFTSVYKHNASLLKQQGDVVKGGEVIALAGSTGELSTGPHLHFELWSEGTPVNPTQFIDFK